MRSKKESEDDRPKIHATPRGGFYVDSADLFHDRRVRETIKKMAALAPKKPGDSVPSKDGSENAHD